MMPLSHEMLQPEKPQMNGNPKNFSNFIALL